MKYRTAIIASALTLALAGCATSNSLVEDTYGDSVRSMIYNQIADPQAASNPDEKPVLGLDGPKAEEVLSVHTDNVTKTTESANDEITLNIGK